MSYGSYQPAHEPQFTKHQNQLFEFDSPATIAKQQNYGLQQPMVQAGGAPTGFSGIPAAPALPQFSHREARPVNLRTRDWSGQPWKGQTDAYAAPAPLLNKSNSNSLLGARIPGGNASYPTSGLQQGLPLQSGLASPATHYTPSSTIPLSHNFHLPSSNLSQSTLPQNLAPSVQGYPLAKNNLAASGIPSAPAFTGFKRGAWRTSTNRPLRHRTRDWGMRSGKGWSGFNSRSVLDESFLRSRPTLAPMAPPHKSMFAARKWRSGPYRNRPLRTRNWGTRNEDGWSFFNRGIYAHESALPFNANRARWADSDISRSAPLQQAPISQPIPQSFAQPIVQSIAQPTLLAAPIAQPLAAPGVPLKGRKGRRAAKKLAKQQAIQARLTNELAPPIGDPAVNHYRRGAKATVPLVGPAIAGAAAPTGSKFGSRRTGRRNNLGRRRGRLATASLPVPATQPPVVAPIATGFAPAPIATSFVQQPTSYVQSSSSFAPIATVPIASRHIAPSFARTQGVSSSAGIPLASGLQSQPSHLYSSSEQQVRPLSSNFAQPISGSNQPLYSAHEPVAAQIMEKQFIQPTARPTGSATF